MLVGSIFMRDSLSIIFGWLVTIFLLGAGTGILLWVKYSYRLLEDITFSVEKKEYGILYIKNTDTSFGVPLKKDEVTAVWEPERKEPIIKFYKHWNLSDLTPFLIIGEKAP